MANFGVNLEQTLELVWHVMVASKIIDFFDVPVSDSKKAAAGETSAS